MKPKLVVFASGSGTNFKAIAQAIHNKTLEAEIVGLIHNRNEIGAIKIAEDYQISSLYINDQDFESLAQFEKSLLDLVMNLKPDLIILAGYLRKIPDTIIKNYKDRIINIHPSLLPKYGGKGYYGLKVHQAVIENNESESGCTVHLVNEEYDRGKILEQIKVPVLPNDSPQELAARILKEEHKLYPLAIKNYLTKIKSKS